MSTDQSAKSLKLKPIASKVAHKFVRENHYSGKTTNNSQLHIGVYWRGELEGAMQFGPPLDRRKLLGLVEGAPWDSVLELNRMAFTERLPRNSESRAISIAFRILRKHAPQVKWVVSFADATQCGDGTIYRASGFKLTGIKKSGNLARIPGVGVIHKMSLESDGSRPRPELGGRSYFDLTGGSYDFKKYVAELGGEILPGHQLRYIRFIDQSWEERLTVPTIPFSEIAEQGGVNVSWGTPW